MSPPRVDKTLLKSQVLHRSLFEEPDNVVSGSGIYLNLESGGRIIDACSGAGVACLGHSNHVITESLTKQMHKISFVYSGSKYTSDPAEELAALLVGQKPGGLVKALFVNSGSEANDGALRLASQYWKEKGEFRRTNFISRKQSFHGNTLSALSISGHQSRREYYKEWVSQNVSFVDPCYAYRAQRDQETDAQYVGRLIRQLEDEMLQVGPDTIAAFIAETVCGSYLGCVPAVPGYFKAVRKLCDKYGILLILDEVMCGMGKTGTLHAWEQEDIRGPDIQTIGKALGGGFLPLSGILINDKVFDALAQGSGGVATSSSWLAHPASCAVALSVQRIIQRDQLVDRVRRLGIVLERLLKEIILPLPFVGDVRGRGLFWGVEFMAEPSKREPFPSTLGFGAKVTSTARRLGLNLIAGSGKSGYYTVDVVMISPPFIVSEDELKTIVNTLAEAIRTVGCNYRVEKRGIKAAL